MCYLLNLLFYSLIALAFLSLPRERGKGVYCEAKTFHIVFTSALVACDDLLGLCRMLRAAAW